MIKIGKDTKDIKFGDKQIMKVCKGDNIIWQKEDELVVESEPNFFYKTVVNNSSAIKPNKAYRFSTNAPRSNYKLSIVGGGVYDIEDNDIFLIDKECEIIFRNKSYVNFVASIYSTMDKPNLIINV
ncbi:MAG: hypothetical protein E6053_09475 [Finegoldia magna]|uniref:hypothetical protein n=1 Tax=Finegoldia magna TaxID=1260 RepID=UPI00290B0D3D|nr:hypothetical protein [Finegoldia magna]MDU5527682.1 hypothetical protein [Finegoldia magna]